MKSTVCTCILLALTLLCIVGNCVYINTTADILLDMIDALPESPEDGSVQGSRQILEYWEKKINYVGLSVGYTVVDRISEQTKTLCTTAESGNFFDYRVAKELLRDAVGDMRRLEQFSIGNLM